MPRRTRYDAPPRAPEELPHEEPKRAAHESASDWMDFRREDGGPTRKAVHLGPREMRVDEEDEG